MSNIKKRPVELLVLGKVGVGKSSFINYILGLKEGDQGYCRTGAGKRTTQEGIFKSQGEVRGREGKSGIPFNLYDSMGLEPSDAETQARWKAMIEYFFSSTEINKPNYRVDKPKRGFCHSVFYCIDSRQKVEEKDVDIEMIKTITGTYHQEITIILTRIDGVAKSIVDALENALYEKFGRSKIYIIRTSSVEGEIEDCYGEKRKTKASGINQARAEILINFLNTLVRWLPKELIKDLKLTIDSEVDSFRKKLKDLEDYTSSLGRKVEDLNREFSERIEGNYYDAMGQKKNNENLAYGLQSRIEDLLDITEINREIDSSFSEFEKKIKDAFTRESKKIDNNFKTLMKDWIEDLQDLITMFELDNLKSDAISIKLEDFKSIVVVETGGDDFDLQTSVDTISDAMRWTNAILGTGGVIATLIAIPEPITTTIGIVLGVANIAWQIFKGPDKGQLRKIKNDLIQQARGYVNDLDKNISAKLETFNTYVDNVIENYNKSEIEISNAVKVEADKIVTDKEKIRKDAKSQDGLK